MQVGPLKWSRLMYPLPQAAGNKQHNHLIEAADVHTGHVERVGQVLQVAVARDHRGFRHPGLRPGRVLARKSSSVTLRQTQTESLQVRHNLSKLIIKFWSDTAHVKELCENQAPRKLAQGFTTGTGGDGRVRLPR